MSNFNILFLLTPSRRTAALRLGCAMAVGAFLAGCTHAPYSTDANAPGYVLGHDSATPIHNANLNGFLDQAPGNSAVTLSTSPWGKNVDIVAGAGYFAASGRRCRKLRIVTPAQQTRQALVCRADSGWVEQRVVTQQTPGERL